MGVPVTPYNNCNKSLENNLSTSSVVQFGYYLAGLLEGDGCIDLPAKGKTTLKRVLNPRIVFTFDKHDLPLYKEIQAKLGGIGRFAVKSKKEYENTMRYIIGTIKGLELFINLLHNKLRTPKNITFNQLINFMNDKYNLNIPESQLDSSDLNSNSWFTGFCEADANFSVKLTKPQPKTLTKRSRSAQVSVRFTISQRAFDRPTSTSMLNIMEDIAKFLSGKLNITKKHPKVPLKLEPIDTLYVEINAINLIGFIVEYFNKFPLLGVKRLNFNDWQTVYNMMLNKEHLTEDGRAQIQSIVSRMNNKRFI